MTLARLRNGKSEEVAHYLALRGGFRAPTFQASRFVLFSSKDSVGGRPYVMEEAFPPTPCPASATRAPWRWPPLTANPGRFETRPGPRHIGGAGAIDFEETGMTSEGGPIAGNTVGETATTTLGAPDKVLVGEILLPRRRGEQARQERRVRKGFLSTLKRAARHIPFMEDVVASYHSHARSTRRPRAGLARHSSGGPRLFRPVPFDVVPDFIVGLGFTDDARCSSPPSRRSRRTSGPSTTSAPATRCATRATRRHARPEAAPTASAEPPRRSHYRPNRSVLVRKVARGRTRSCARSFAGTR